MSTVVKHKLLGEFVYEGMTWHCLTSASVIEKVKTFPLEDGDIIVSSYTKADLIGGMKSRTKLRKKQQENNYYKGTTWNQEILDLVMNDGKSNEKKKISEKVPWLEFSVPFNRTMNNLKPGRKLLKSHLGYPYFKNQVAGGKAKFIVPMRNLKDNLVSFYHFYRSAIPFRKFSGTFDQFFWLFKEKRLCGGDWLDFNLSWWNERHRENVHIVFYEDLKSNPAEEIRKIAEFCDKNLSDEVLETIVEKTSFEAMKDNPLTNYSNHSFVIDKSISPFMRKGQVGDWKNYFTAEQLQYINEHYEPKLKDAGLIFKDEL